LKRSGAHLTVGPGENTQVLLVDTAISIVLSISYATYGERLAQGTLGPLVADRPCPVRGCRSRLALTGKKAKRGAVFPEGRSFHYDRIVVAVARCLGDGGKRHWHRVLPAELSHGKVFSVPAVEAAVSECVRKNRSLRGAVGVFKGEAPHYTTLHGWIGGLGRYALMRDAPEEGLPFGALLAQSRRRGLPEAEAIFRKPVRISPARYLSEARREVMAAAAGLLAAARAVAPRVPFPFAAWVSRAAGFDLVAPVRWWARTDGTRIRHRVHAPGSLHSRPKARSP
jgi:hypothetical protein